MARRADVLSGERSPGRCSGEIVTCGSERNEGERHVLPLDSERVYRSAMRGVDRPIHPYRRG